MAGATSLQRVAYSPGEFAELFGKSQTWGYRQIYSGKVTAITEHGRILIPAKEVERVLEGAGIYNGMEKPRDAKAREKKLSPEQKDIRRRYIESRTQAPQRISSASADAKQRAKKWIGTSRSSELTRIARAWEKSAGG